MDYFFSLTLFILFYIVWKFFMKKLVVLLAYESLMICLIFLYSVCYSFSSFSFFVMMIFSLFMVLDSVFGICILIFSSRDSSNYSFYFNSI